VILRLRQGLESFASQRFKIIAHHSPVPSVNWYRQKRKRAVLIQDDPFSIKSGNLPKQKSEGKSL